MESQTAPETVRLTADVVLFGEREGEVYVLVIQRGWPPFEGRWALPGGHVDAGEDVDVAARRELAEETGLRVGALDLVGAYADPGRDPRGRYVTFAFTARLTGRLPRPTAGDDAAAARWVPVDDLLSDPVRSLAFDHGRIIRNALSRLA